MEKYLCKDCIWVNSQANESGMVYCKLLNQNVYGGSVPCPSFELYVPPTKGKRSPESAVQ